jgi:hypothetical protein
MTNTAISDINFTSSVPTALLSISKGFKSSVDAVAPYAFTASSHYYVVFY